MLAPGWGTGTRGGSPPGVKAVSVLVCIYIYSRVYFGKHELTRESAAASFIFLGVQRTRCMAIIHCLVLVMALHFSALQSLPSNCI